MFNNKKIKNLENEFLELVANVNELRTKSDNMDSRLIALESELQEYLNYKKKKDSDEVYLEIISESFNPETGIELKIDWNDAAINYLKRNGYQGINDDEIIEKYLSDLFKQSHREIK